MIHTSDIIKLMEFKFSFNAYCNKAKRIFQPEDHRVPIWLPSLEK